MFDDFIFRYKYFIGAGLILIILAGGGYLIFNKYGQNKSSSENQQITDLKKQNDDLRAQLSNQSTSQVAGTSTENTTNTENQLDKININSATAIELDKLPGIGAVRAADIISYRESHGGFQTIEELKNIKGIGDKSFEKLKDLVTVGE